MKQYDITEDTPAGTYIKAFVKVQDPYARGSRAHYRTVPR